MKTYIAEITDNHGETHITTITIGKGPNGERLIDKWDAATYYAVEMGALLNREMTVVQVVPEGRAYSLTGGNARANGFRWNRAAS